MTQVCTSVSFLIFYQQCINFFILLDLRCTHILHTPFLPYYSSNTFYYFFKQFLINSITFVNSARADHFVRPN